MAARRIPLNFFAMPFGLAGLGGSWLTMAGYHRAPRAVGTALLALSALVWIVVLARYLRYAIAERGILRRDLTDPIAAPFASLAVLTPILLSAQGVYPLTPTTGRVLLDVFVALTVLLGGLFTGQWIYRPLDIDHFHPGYLLPTVAGGALASAGAAEVGQHQLAEAMFGLSVICWLALGSVVLNRMLFRPMLPVALIPTIAIEVAPAATASLAYFALHGDHIDIVVALIGGYGLLTVLSQLRMLPAFLRLPFMPSTWTFTFSWPAAASTGLHWLNDDRPAGYPGYEYLVLTAITVLVGGIAVRTLIALGRRELLPKPTSSSPAATDHAPA